MPSLRQQGKLDYFKSLDPEEEAEIGSLSVPQLNTLLFSHQCSTDGNKAQKQKRIKHHLQTTDPRIQFGNKACIQCYCDQAEADEAEKENNHETVSFG